MLDILRYFSSSGRSIGKFCDGVEPKEIHTLLNRRSRPQSAVLEYENLYRYLDDLINSGRVEYVRADENTTSLVASEDCQLELMPVGPRPAIARMAVRDSVASGKIRADLNKLSIVLALVAHASNRSFHALLAADTDAEGFSAALACLKGRIKASSDPTFDFIKVPHHGSLDSHRGSKICGCHKMNSQSIAAISAGHLNVLPDRAVIGDFLNSNWIVLLTTKRFIPRQRALPLFGKSDKSVIEVRTQNLKIEWSDENGLSWEPVESRVEAAELLNYETAGILKARAM
jgi:hypothetical protein